MQHQASALEVPEDYHVRFEYIINEPEVTPEDPLAQRAAIAIKWKIPGDFLKGNDIEGGDDGQLIIGPSGEPKPFRYG